ncbi:MAG TPA: ABC transporter permease [Ktedonobacteraceae bacterium]|nr:ABC transporter permease [Ktedonobacteraceae bacterium]
MLGTAREANAIVTIAYRDVLKFARDPSRLIATLVLPVLFVGLFGEGLQAAFGSRLGYNYLTFVFLGVFAQTLFQSTALGIVSLIEDRENDFAQEIFISPISRYSLVFGKILGESLVALSQAVVIVAFGAIIGVQLNWMALPGLLLAAIVTCLLGGAFGLLLLSTMGSQRAANQILPFLIIPQLILAGVFNPLKGLPLYLDLASRIAPLRYAVDLTRAIYYAGQPATYNKVVLVSPLINLFIMTAMFVIFLVIGTVLFVRSERNK